MTTIQYSLIDRTPKIDGCLIYCICVCEINECNVEQN